MGKVILSILLIYAVSLSIELPLKRYVSQNNKAYLGLTEVVLAPLMVTIGVSFMLLESGKTCLIGCP